MIFNLQRSHSSGEDDLDMSEKEDMADGIVTVDYFLMKKKSWLNKLSQLTTKIIFLERERWSFSILSVICCPSAVLQRTSPLNRFVKYTQNIYCGIYIDLLVWNPKGYEWCLVQSLVKLIFLCDNWSRTLSLMVICLSSLIQKLCWSSSQSLEEKLVITG